MFIPLSVAPFPECQGEPVTLISEVAPPPFRVVPLPSDKEAPSSVVPRIANVEPSGSVKEFPRFPTENW